MAGLFGSKTLFSEVKGVVTINGEPCTGARIEQKVFNSNKDEVTAETETDESGQFKFDEVSESKGFADFLPSQFVVSQALIIHCEGNEYIGWANTKISADKNSESNGKPMLLVCDLSKELEEKDQYRGICRLKEV